MARAAIDLNDEIISILRQSINVGTKNTIKTLSEKSNTKLAEWAKSNLTNSFKSSIFRNKLVKVHEDLGDIAKDKMIDAYKAGLSGRQSYRQEDQGANKRYSGGMMLKGLQSDSYIKTSVDGIQFNFGELFKYGQQWARLNFGTQGRGSKKVKDEKIKIFRQNLQDSPSLAGIGSRKGFYVPSGRGAFGVSSTKAFGKTPSPGSIIRTPMGNEFLYVYGTKKGLGKRAFRNKKSKGILGWRFLDQGINAMNKAYGPKLTEMLTDVMNGKTSSGSETSTTRTRWRPTPGSPGQTGGASARPSRPAPSAQSVRARLRNRDALGRFARGYKKF